MLIAILKQFESHRMLSGKNRIIFNRLRASAECNVSSVRSLILGWTHTKLRWQRLRFTTHALETNRVMNSCQSTIGIHKGAFSRPPLDNKRLDTCKHKKGEAMDKCRPLTWSNMSMIWHVRTFRPTFYTLGTDRAHDGHWVWCQTHITSHSYSRSKSHHSRG